MKKELREQIRQDEFQGGIEKALSWLMAHRDEVRIGAGVVAVLLAAAGALAYFQGQRAREADRAFRDALTTFEAPVTAALPAGANPPAGQVFATAEEKYKTAAAAFEGVERRFGSSTTGLRAKYLGALARVELGQYDEAEKALKELQGRGSGLEAELARFALADIQRRRGQPERAIEAYRGLATNPAAEVPRDFALLSAAQTAEGAERWDEAQGLYRQLFEEFPASVYAAEARQRAEWLKTRG